MTSMTSAHAPVLADRPAGAPWHAGTADPFDLDDGATYRRWRAWKLDRRVRAAQELVVEVRDLRALASAERARLLQLIGRHGVAVYRSPRTEAASELPRALGAQLGLVRLHANWLADEDGISPIAVQGRAQGVAAGDPQVRAARGEFIPYTDRAIGWHTDGYYQADDQRILGMILHCVRPAAAGGETALADPELLYIALRDEDPALVRALTHARAMSIPARESGSEGGSEGGGEGESESKSDGERGVARAEQSGPVFGFVGTVPPRLHMRYTARTRSIRWRDDALTRVAAARITALLEGGGLALHLRLEAGMGLVGHNVLHKRNAFTDDLARPRLLYRARFLDRVAAAEEDAWRERPASHTGEGAGEGAGERAGEVGGEGQQWRNG